MTNNNSSSEFFSSRLSRGVAEVFPFFTNNQSKSLRVKLGIDPTSPDIHLGHSILFRKLRAFQDAGHTAVLIIGDFTACIGDPTGKNNTRKQLTIDEVKNNASTYLQQLGKGKSAADSLLDFETPGRLEIHYNSEWLKNLNLLDLVSLMSTTTVGQMLAKEDFSKRYNSNVPISLHEFLYPLLQGYDSVAVDADVELGGTDQKFNVGMGRDLQRYYGKRPQTGILMPILPGLDGVQKMSKSLGNTVGINEDPISMYSKLEKTPDTVVEDYVTLLTDFNLEAMPSSQREKQQLMAFEVTSLFHGKAAAEKAKQHVEMLIKGNNDSVVEVPSILLSDVELPSKLFYLLKAFNLCPSSSMARKLIENGGVKINGVKVENPSEEFTAHELNGKILQIGRNTFRRFALG